MIKPQNILVLGANGFIGRHLCDHLASGGSRVIRADMTGGVDYTIDALKRDMVSDLLGKIRPEVIFNLIGYTNEEHPETIYKLNIIPVINLVDATVSLGLNARIITMGSAAEYGNAAQEGTPLKENDIKMPVSHYGVSKAAQTMLSEVFFRSKGVDLIVARPFNVLGFGMSASAVPACFITQFLRGMNNKGVTEIRTGDLSPVRDFLSVRDVVSALRLIMLSGSSGECYNISSAAGVTMENVLKHVADNFPGMEYKIKETKNVKKGSHIPWSIGDNSKLSGIGWNRRDSLEDGIGELVRMMKNAAF